MVKSRRAPPVQLEMLKLDTSKNTKLTIALLLVSVAIDFLQTNILENV